MASEHENVAQKQRKSGSENRKMLRRVTFRLTHEEYALLEAAARDAGLTLGSFIRVRALGMAQTRQWRRPSFELETIARLHAEMNRVGSNIHQILKRMNFGELVLAHEYREALAGYREVIDAILEALGRRRAA